MKKIKLLIAFFFPVFLFSQTVKQKQVIGLKDTFALYQKNNGTKDIDYIVQPTTGAALSSEWTAVGAPAYTVSAGQFVFAGGVNSTAKYLKNNKGVLSEKSTLSAYIKCNTINATDSGVTIGYRSYASIQNELLVTFITGSTNFNKGRIKVVNTAAAVTLFSTDVNTNIVNGDEIFLSIKRYGRQVFIYVKNITKNWVINYDYVVAYPNTGASSGNVVVFPNAGSYTVRNLKYTDNVPVTLQYCIVGNSITDGYQANQYQRYADNVGNPFNNIVMGGGGDKIGDVLNRVYEIIAIKPARALLMIGGNDLQFNAGVMTTQMKNDLILLRDTLLNNGIKPVLLYPTPRDGVSMIELVTFLDTCSALKTTEKIKTTWTGLLGTGTNILAKYFSDGTHPNIAGHAKIASVVNEYLHFANNNNFTIAGNLFARDGYIAGISTGDPIGSFKSGGVIAFKQGEHSTKSYYTQMGYDVNGGYLQAIAEGVAYTPMRINGNGGNVTIGGQAAPLYPLEIYHNGGGTKVGLNIHHAQVLATGEENQQDFSINTTTIGRIASVYFGTNYGFKFYTYNGSLNATPNFELKGDLSSVFNGDLIIKTKTPATATAAGTTGMIAWDTSFIYICTATNTWKRVAIATW